jgi:predicted metal-binding membrane protein
MMLGVAPPPSLGRTVLVVAVLALSLAAWLALWLGEIPGHGLPHHAQGGHGPPFFPVLFISGWTVMTVAMMLPTSLPVLATFHAIAGRRPDRPLLVGLAVTGYLVAWGLFGLLVYLAHVLLQLFVMSAHWFHGYSWAAAPLLFILAGAFQFSSVKYRCLEKCRSPLSFVMEHWQGHHDRWQALRLGVDNGVFCVGCCWALMLLMFGFGISSFVWMMILAAVMAIEKNVSWGRRISSPVGAALIVWGLVLLR